MSTTATNMKKRSTSFWINTAITIALMIFFQFLPTFGAVTPMGMKVLGVFLGMLYGWITIEMIWPSILGLVVFGLTGYTTVSGVFGTCLDSQVMQAFMCFLVAALFDVFGVTNYLASKVMSIKLVIGRPWIMVLFIYLAVAVISILSSTTAAIFVMWAVTLKVAEAVGCEKHDKFIGFIIAGIVYVGFNTGMILPFKATTVTYMSFLTGTMDLEIPFGPYIVTLVLFNIVVLALWMIFGKYVLKLDTSKFTGETDHFAYMRGIKADKNQKIGLVFIAIFIIALMLPSFLPADMGLSKLLTNLGLIGVIAVLIVVGAILRDDEGKPIAPISKLMSGISWEIVWLLAATFPIAAAMRSEECGIMLTVNNIVRPLVSGMGPYMLIIVTVVLLGIITQFTHNIVLAAMFVPFICPLVVEMGGSAIVAWLSMYLVLQAAYATPAGSMPAAFVFGHGTMQEGKMGYLYGISIFVIMLIVIIAFIPLEIMLF